MTRYTKGHVRSFGRLSGSGTRGLSVGCTQVVSRALVPFFIFYFCSLPVPGGVSASFDDNYNDAIVNSSTVFGGC